MIVASQFGEMPVVMRPKLFLTFAVLCVSPLLILSLINFRSGLKNANSLIRSNLDDELADASWGFQTLLHERERELRALASGPVRSYVRFVKSPPPDAAKFAANSSMSEWTLNAVYETKKGVGKLLFDQGYYADVACFAPDKRPLFLAEPSKSELQGLSFRTRDFLPGQVLPDESVWNAPEDAVLCSLASHPSFGEVLRCSTPVHTLDETNFLRGVLVADLRLDSLVAEVVRTRESSSSGDKAPSSRINVVLGPSGNIVYHTSTAYKHQPVGSAMPSFASAASSMTSGQTGSTLYVSAEGDQWLESHVPLKPPGLSLAVARNYSQATQPARRAGWLGIALSILFGLAGAVLLTILYQRKPQSLERVTQSVAAIAQGKLDQELLLRSSDDMRVLADNVNLMTERLREQLAREAEARQFESFIKLSALLTHDLKNAIEGLSLMVGNMERHFDNPKFRADAMRALTDATDKLRHIVSRLSIPVNTMSGEFKMPRPTDLVPLLQRVLARNVDPVRDTHQVEVKLPSSLMAMADGERIEKVMENLTLNAIEAMAGKRGTLTIEADLTDEGKAFFSISDTGVGISPEFIQQKLFRPFATSKVRGVGLGLYTCREVVRANGGVIEVESRVDSGTTFRVVLASAQIK
jgi:signal transduction histidine kinase